MHSPTVQYSTQHRRHTNLRKTLVSRSNSSAVADFPNILLTVHHTSLTYPFHLIYFIDLTGLVSSLWVFIIWRFFGDCVVLKTYYMVFGFLCVFLLHFSSDEMKPLEVEPFRYNSTPPYLFCLLRGRCLSSLHTFLLSVIYKFILARFVVVFRSHPLLSGCLLHTTRNANHWDGWGWMHNCSLSVEPFDKMLTGGGNFKKHEKKATPLNARTRALWKRNFSRNAYRWSVDLGTWWTVAPSRWLRFPLPSSRYFACGWSGTVAARRWLKMGSKNWRMWNKERKKGTR